MSNESFVRVRPDDPNGKRVRTRSVMITGQQYEQQVIVPASRHGDFESLVDAFGRARGSSPFALFDAKHMLDKLPLYFDEVVTGGGLSTYDGSNSQVVLSVTGGTDSVIRQSKMRFNYQPGRSQMFLFTGLFSQQANVRKRIGAFDNSNGIFFQVDGTGPSFGIMKNGTVTEQFAQANWNLDKLDGTGPSGFVLNLAACQVMTIDYEWLGTGPARVGFFLDGVPVYVHKFQHANEPGFTSVYMAQPNLPVRYEIVSQGGAGTLQHICSNVVAEGGQEFLGVTYSVDMGAAPFTVPSTGVQVLLAFRLKSTPAAHLSAVVLPVNIHIAATAVANMRWTLLMNPNVAGPALSWVDVENASIQRALGAGSNLATGGTQIDSGYLGSQDRITVQPTLTRLRIGAKIDGTPDILVLAMETVTGGTTPVVAAVQFNEWL